MNDLRLSEEINTLSLILFTVCFIVSEVTFILSAIGMAFKASAIPLKYSPLIWIGFSYAGGGACWPAAACAGWATAARTMFWGGP
jgi:hypothetical protein